MQVQEIEQLVSAEPPSPPRPAAPAPHDWQPASYVEWEARERARTVLAAWSSQTTHERSLRSFTARRIFVLIVVQVVSTFALVVAQGAGWLKIDVTVLKVLIPSVLTEVFGLGFLVIRYLFSQPLRHRLDALVREPTHGA